MSLPPPSGGGACGLAEPVPRLLLEKIAPTVARIASLPVPDLLPLAPGEGWGKGTPMTRLFAMHSNPAICHLPSLIP